MTDLYERDPEEVGPEHPDDLDARMRFIEARHEFVGDARGRCVVEVQKYCNVHKVVDFHQFCNLFPSSILHIDDKLDNHDHGGGDCMCFEGVIDCE
jgi:hypothetical protein